MVASLSTFGNSWPSAGRRSSDAWMKPSREPSAASTSELEPGSRSLSEDSEGAEAATETT
jgi:hypothetical protein